MNQSMLQQPIVNAEGNAGNPIDEKIFENICQRRIMLTKKLLIVERFSDLYEKCVVKDNDRVFVVKGKLLTLKEFLWSMKISANSQEENVTEESLLRTKLNLDKNFDYENHIVYTIPRRMQRDNLDYERKAKAEQNKIDHINNNLINENNENNDNNDNNNASGNQDKEDKEIYKSLANELDKYEFLLRLSKNYTAGNKQDESNEGNECTKVYCENCVNNNKCINENSNLNEENNENNIIEERNSSNNFRIGSMPFVPIRPCANNTHLINENCDNIINNQNKEKNIREIQKLENNGNEEEEEKEERELTNENYKHFFQNFRKQGLLPQENQEDEENESLALNNQNTNKINFNNSDYQQNKPPAYGYNPIRSNYPYNTSNPNESTSNNLISINQSNSDYNYRDPELEEEVNQAESIVDQLHQSNGQRLNSDDLIAVLESKEAEVNKLKIEKDKLVLRKQKTEQVLEMLKKFIVLKDNMSKNKRYYKVISYLLARVRSNDNGNVNNSNYDTFNLSQIIGSGQLEEIISNENFDNFFDASYETQEEIQNFRQLDELIKEIEVGLLKQVNDIFGDHACENNNFDN